MEYLRGNEIKKDVNGRYVYIENNQLTSETYKDVPCGSCNEKYTEEGHDPCLGTLEGVINACCGHGDTKTTYVQFEDKSTIRGEKAVQYFNGLKTSKDAKSKTSK